ncbi:MAG: hypothetical protein U0163_06150 [Gemmatimonadaceae bacterium]
MAMRTLRPLSVGEVLDTTVGVYREAFVPLFLLSIVTQIVPQLLAVYQSDDLLSAGFTSLLLRLVIGAVLGAVGSAASTFVVAETYLGRSLTMGDALQQALPFIGRILSVALLVSLVTFLGFVLLIVPGVIAFCGLLLSTPALVIEGLPSARTAMSRSWALTTGLRGRVFVILFVGFLLLWLPMIAVSGVSSMLGGSDVASMALIFLLVGGVLQLLIYPFFYVATVVLYYDARVRKEGFDLDLLSQTLLPR